MPWLSILSFFKSRNAQYGLAIVVGLIVLYVVVRKLFKKPYTEKPLPDNGQGIPAGWEPVMRALVEELHHVLNDWVSGSVKEMTFRKINDETTPDQLTAIYNEFNRLYQKEEGRTLTQWIKDEWLVGGESRNRLVNRLISNKLP